MEYKDFAEKIADAVQERLGEGQQVSNQKVRKNNNITFRGLIIMGKESNVYPTIYLEAFYKDFTGGRIGFDDAVAAVIDAYQKSEVNGQLDMSFFRAFDTVKNNVCMKLINKEKNAGLLEQVPYKEYLDMAIVFYAACSLPGIGEGQIGINNDHIKMWGVTADELWEAASVNTPVLKRVAVAYLEELLLEGMDAAGGEVQEEVREALFKEDVLGMQVVTNSDKMYGACAMMYPGVLEQLADQHGGDLVILPSSVHEVIVLPMTQGINVEDCRAIVKEVNSEQLAPDEVLSDNLYVYRREQNRLEIV